MADRKPRGSRLNCSRKREDLVAHPEASYIGDIPLHQEGTKGNQLQEIIIFVQHSLVNKVVQLWPRHMDERQATISFVIGSKDKSRDAPS
ncbi:hypothetical protein TB1_024898 [Malus domestica]